ncbi:MAG: BamA/TamA family outer membrane protein [Gammaproteobacteria bacterium]
MRRLLIILITFCIAVWPLKLLAIHDIHYKISGISGPILTNVSSRLQQYRAQYPQQLTAEDVTQLTKDNQRQIELALQPFGYFQPRLEQHIVATQPDWQIHYTIQHGPAVHITDIKLTLTGQGQQDRVFTQLQHSLSKKRGERFAINTIETIQQQLFQIAALYGYIDAKLAKRQIQINRQQLTARIHLIFDTGPHYTIGNLHFNNNPYSDKFLQRFFNFGKDRSYSAKRVLELQQTLSNTVYFKDIRITPLFNQIEQNRVPLDVNVTPQKPHAFSIGAGYGTDTGARGKFGWDWRRINSRGHHSTTQLEISERRSNVLAKYIIPGKHPLTDEYNVNTRVTHNDTPRGDSIVTALGAGYTKRWRYWTRTLAIDLQHERFKLENQQTDTSSLLIPSTTWIYAKSDDLLNPTHGDKINFKVSGAQQGILANTSFLQFKIASTHLRSLTAKNRILLHTELGYTAADPDDLPLSLSFLTGGSRSLRGFRYQSIGPGRYLVTGSIEYQYRFTENWYGTMFYDVGNAFNHAFNPVKQSLGFGIKRQTPLGPLEIALASPISESGHSLRLVFNLGPEL